MESPTPIERAIRPFQQFASREASGGIVLFVATIAALLFANSPWAEHYFASLQFEAGWFAGGYRENYSTQMWINDGLMAVFFLLVGLEIKRELLVGELSSLRQAALPMVAALGGMVVPASLYLAFTYGTPAQRGWGVPMATDIAFALGILALLGSRAPYGLKVFLAALAIVDDLGAVLVIALFFTGGIDMPFLLGALAVLVCMIGCNAIGVRKLRVYVILGLALWWLVHHSGLHATLAGVITAMTIPSKSRIDAKAFAERVKSRIQEFISAAKSERPGELSEEEASSLHEIEFAIERATTPLRRLMEAIHPLVAFMIVPLFGFANAGMHIDATRLADLVRQPAALGIILGLSVGKIVGIAGFSWIALRARVGVLPEGVTFMHVVGAAALGGIGFTMSVFIAQLAFLDEAALETAKLAILVGSLLAGLVGWSVLSRLATNTKPSTSV